MIFKVLISPNLFNKLPNERKDKIKAAIAELENPFPDESGNKKEIKGTKITSYRLRVGNYRVFYHIDDKEKKVYVFDILTAEQAHKTYGKL